MFQRGVKKYIVLFIIGFLFLMTLVFAMHNITPSRVSVNQDVVNLFNITINNTDVGINITQVNLTLPATFTFITHTNGTNQTFTGSDFVNTSNTLSWSNLTGGYVVNGSQQVAFWFNATSSTPGEFNITVMTLNVSGPTYGNFSVTVNDTRPPTISIITPGNSTNSTQTGLNINYTVTDQSALSNCWYANDTYSANTTITCGTNITTATWTEGWHNVTIWANDTLNNVNSSRVTFGIDTTQPAISIATPANNTNSSTNQLNINYTVSDSGVGLSNCWYSNDTYTTNQTITCGTNITTATWTEGWHNVTIWANDTLNNVNSSRVTFGIDTTQPAISIATPANNTNSSTNQLNINYTVSDSGVGLSNCWYSNDTYTTNQTITCGTNITTATWTEGQHNVTVWSNDTVNNVNKTNVRFFIDTIGPYNVAFNTSTPADGANLSLSNLAINISALDRVTGVNTIRIYVYNSTSFVNNTNVTTPSSAFINITGLPNQIYYINATANDTLNNQNLSGTGTRRITLDTVAPTISFSCSPTDVLAGDIITCGCTGSDILDSNPSEGYSVNPITNVASGSYTATCTSTDSAGNSASASAGYTVRTGGGSGGGGGGGGGGGSTATTEASISNSWAFMGVGTNYVYNIPASSNLAFDSIALTPNDNIINVKIVVRQYSLQPSSVLTAPAGSLFKYAEIVKENLPSSNIKTASVKFSINKDWVDSKGKKESILLLRYVNNKWETLSTRFIAETNGEYQYEADTPGFSYFAIVYQTPVEQKKQEAQNNAVKTGTPETPPAEEEKIVTGEEIVGETVTTKAEKTKWWKIIVALVVVLFAVIMFYIISKNNKNKGIGLRKHTF